MDHNIVGIATVQVGSNPAVLNGPDADPDAYTVCGGMSTEQAEAWGPGAPLSDESAKGLIHQEPCVHP